MSLAERFMRLFAGLDRAHGRYDLSKTVMEGDKRKGFAKTVAEPITLQLWQDHLAGTTGLGVVPIRDDSTVVWGAIDVDKYNIDLVALSRRLFTTPLVLCRSKSGGAHIFCFTQEPVPASLMQEKLSRIAASLGYGGVEIFPKQTELLTDRGDTGNWLNMPYFGGEGSTRYAMLNGESVTPEEFLAAAEERRVSFNDLAKLVVGGEADDEAIPDGPPCLQLMCRNGIASGGRNNALYNIGVYLKMVDPDTWKGRLEEYNRRYVQPPLEAGEVIALHKSLDKKQYHYTCDREPLASHCDKRACVKRRYGVRCGESTEPDLPIISGLIKFDTDPPMWFVDVEGRRLGPVDTECLQMQGKFQKLCMEQINKMPPIVKPQRWEALVNALMEQLQVVEVPADSSAYDQMWDHLEKFCTGRARCDQFDELLVSDKPFTDPEAGLTYFKLIDFIEYLERRRFKTYTPQKLVAWLKERGASHEEKNIQGKNVRLWIIPCFAESSVVLSTPSSSETPF